MVPISVEADKACYAFPVGKWEYHRQNYQGLYFISMTHLATRTADVSLLASAKNTPKTPIKENFKLIMHN